MIKNLIQRALTGLVYISLIIGGIVWNQYSFLALFLIVVSLCLVEFYGLLNTQKRTQVNVFYNTLGGLIMLIATYLYASGTFPHWIFFAYLIYVVIVLISSLYEKKQDPILNIAYIFLGQVYIALPIALLNFLVFNANTEGIREYTALFILALFVFIWINDTGAYLVGVTIGKHRLFERISPKKSWEGFFGGLVFAALASLAFAHYVPEIAWYHWVGMSVFVVAFSTWGDLVESLMKRDLSVKDSGQALPGHGGFLDRFDSLLMAVYAMLFYTQLFILQ
ncbi:phosphatidate cytidylyltransferase [Bacteroidales bacterium OttesenSCG-928-L03]|nr:phosphatidate cytidylyltransferase [Bacteroidales bacterium OttesenSCG-928-L03]